MKAQFRGLRAGDPLGSERGIAYRGISIADHWSRASLMVIAFGAWPAETRISAVESYATLSD